MRIHPEAEDEFKNAIRFYGAKARETAVSFALELEASFNRIDQNPLAYPIYGNNARKYTMRRFPFNIFYTIKNGKIFIVAVVHQRRKSDYWKKRV